MGGLGGWAHGEFWHIPLSHEDCSLLHITAWEFIALGVNVIVFGLQLKGFRVHLFADALATVQILASQAAHSPIMQRILLARSSASLFLDDFWNTFLANATHSPMLLVVQFLSVFTFSPNNLEFQRGS